MRKTKKEAEKTRKEIVEAARRVFHRHGVGRSTLEKIAKEAGVTRGAVYWHFENKAEVFYAMHAEVFEPMVASADALLFSDQFSDPLDAVEASLLEFFRIIQSSPEVREVFEIMISRCEYVDEFASVQEEIGRPGEVFLAKMEHFYQQAQAKGTLRKGLDPRGMARDTWAFCSGLLHLLLACGKNADLDRHIPEMVAGHMALRRA